MDKPYYQRESIHISKGADCIDLLKSTYIAVAYFITLFIPIELVYGFGSETLFEIMELIAGLILSK